MTKISTREKMRVTIRESVLLLALFALSLVPGAWATLFLMAFVTASNALGHIPVPMIDDPSLMAPYNADYQAAYYRLLSLDERAVIACSIAWFFLFFGMRRLGDNRNYRFSVLCAVLFAVGVTLVLCIVFGNPMRSFEWFMD